MNISTAGRSVTSVALFVVVAAASSALRADSADLGSAKALYAQASYEDALVQLADIKDADVANQVDQYRALCLLALGRDREAQASLERIVVRAPQYTVKADEASPKLVTLFQQVRERALPAAAKNLYVSARASFDGKRFAEARIQFEEMLAIVREVGAFDSSSPLADLKQLGEGFLKLASVELTPAVPAVPPPVAPRVVSAAARAFYTSADADVAPPEDIVRELPAWNPPAALPNLPYSGTLQIDIDERGLVERAVLTEPIAPPYDNRLIAATKAWRFQPATRNGVAVKYRKSFSIVLQPVPKS